MGSGATKGPVQGVAVNPRVNYTDKRSRTDQKGYLIDAPVLVKLQHGTVRYRFKEDEKSPGSREERVEYPHEGPERHQKHGYFFHSRLQDFSENAAYKKEEPWKFCYVYKGAQAAKQKKLYYVFGRGMQIGKEGLIKPGYKTGQSYQFPVMYKKHGHVYYDLIFLRQDKELNATPEALRMSPEDDRDPEATLQPVELKINQRDTVHLVQQRVAASMFKPPAHVHLFLHNDELRSDQQLGPLRRKTEGKWKNFRVLLKPK